MKIVIYPEYDLWNFALRSLKEEPNVELYPLNNYCSIPQIAIRRYLPSYKAPIPFLIGRRLRKRLSLLKDDDSVILCDYFKNVGFMAAISKCVQAKTPLHLWLWNSIIKNESYFSRLKDEIEAIGFTIHTFDQKDAEKFKFQYHKQFFPIRVYQEIPKNNNYWSDFYFLGAEKGRADILHEISKILSGYNLDFKIAKNLSEYITYDENINNVMHTRCIVDIVQANQGDLTLRPLEAMAFRKKLLTNNHNILNADFYHRNNIFVIGHDDWADIGDFLIRPYVEINDEILRSYDVLTWINDFE